MHEIFAKSVASLCCKCIHTSNINCLRIISASITKFCSHRYIHLADYSQRSLPFRLTRVIPPANPLNFTLLVCSAERFSCESHSPRLVSSCMQFCSRSTSVNKNPAERKCWKCERPTNRDKERFFCSPCNVIQKPDYDLNYFDLMGVSVTFDVDLSLLSQRFIELQKILHPDKFATKSEIEKTYADLQSSRVNKAYRTLQRPLSRALYLFKLHDAPLKDGEITMQPAFLIEIMDINEELAASDTLSNKSLKEIGDDNKKHLDRLLNDLSLEFERHDYEEAKKIVSKLKYFINIDDKVKEIQMAKGWLHDQ